MFSILKQYWYWRFVIIVTLRCKMPPHLENKLCMVYNCVYIYQNNIMWVVCVKDFFKIQWIKYLFLFSSQIQNLSCIVFDSIRTVLNLKVISSPSWWRPRETVCMGEAGGKVRLNLGLYLKALATCWCRPLVPSWRPAEMQQSWALVQQLLSQCHDNITQW